MTTKVMAKNAPEPVGPYPHARRVGDFIFVSGMGPRKAGKDTIPGVEPHNIDVQTRSTIENIRIVLEEAGSSLEDVVDVTVFLTRMDKDFDVFNEVYAEYFAQVAPTRTTVEVLSLPTPIAVELKCIAYRPLS